MASDLALARRARREGYVAYTTSFNNWAAGFLAGTLLMLSPVFIRLAASMAALFSEIPTRGLNFRLAFGPNWQASLLYMRQMGWLIALGGILGAVMAVLRRTRGFRSRWVMRQAYERRIRSPLYPYQIVAYIGAPVLVIGMIVTAYGSHVAGRAVPNMLIFWLPSGVVALPVWELIHEGIIRLIHRRAGPLPRDLQREFELKQALEAEPELQNVLIRSVQVTSDGRALVEADVPEETARRIRQRAATIDGIREIEVRPAETGL